MIFLRSREYLTHGVVEIETMTALFQRLDELCVVLRFVVAVSHFILRVDPVFDQL